MLMAILYWSIPVHSTHTCLDRTNMWNCVNIQLLFLLLPFHLLQFLSTRSIFFALFVVFAIKYFVPMFEVLNVHLHYDVQCNKPPYLHDDSWFMIHKTQKWCSEPKVNIQLKPCLKYGRRPEMSSKWRWCAPLVSPGDSVISQTLLGLLQMWPSTTISVDYKWVYMLHCMAVHSAFFFFFLQRSKIKDIIGICFR